jgi:hypothetical protein
MSRIKRDAAMTAVHSIQETISTMLHDDAGLSEEISDIMAARINGLVLDVLRDAE